MAELKRLRVNSEVTSEDNDLILEAMRRLRVTGDALCEIRESLDSAYIHLDRSGH